MVGDASPTGYFGQTYALEFTVEGNLDGTTVSPTVDDSPPTGQNANDPQNLYRRTVDALGLIDPDYLPAQDSDDRRGARGNRFVSFLWIEGPVAGAVGASVDIVDAVDGAAAIQESIGSLEGETRLFSKAIFIPQGSMIRVNGLSGSPASPIKVRLHVQFLENARDLAAALEAQAAVESATPPQMSTERSFAMDGILSGDLLDYFGGFYFFGSTDSDFSVPAVLGTTVGGSGVAYGAHAFIVTGAVPASDVRIQVSGNSVNDSGARVVGDTENITIPGASSVNAYFETAKKWVGPVTFTLISGPATTSNYGLAKYWDNNNSDFVIEGVDVTWTATTNDPSVDISLIHHRSTGWTFNAGSTPTPPSPVASMATDYGSDDAIAVNQNGAWKRTNLQTPVHGADAEGTIFRLDTSLSNAIINGTIILTIR